MPKFKAFIVFSIILSIYLTPTLGTDLPLICEKCSCENNMTKIINCDGRKFRSFNFSNVSLWLIPNQDNGTLSLAEVEEFSFESNLITKVTAFPKLPIRVLKLKFNNIHKIEVLAFQHLQQMVELDLSENFLTSENLTSEVFQGEYEAEDPDPMQSLILLRLSHNSLASLKYDLFMHTDRLETLMLDHNPFVVIDRSTATAIGSLRNLKVLDLSFTSIKTIPSFLLPTTNTLMAFNLTGNELERLPVAALSATQQLEWLSISGNAIESLSGKNVFPRMKSLKHLFLNEMTKLRFVNAGAFSGLPKLESLSMKRNDKLEYIDKDAFVLKKNATSKAKTWAPIKHLELDSNPKLNKLDVSMLSNWAKLEHLDLRNNPWLCSCETQWMISTLVPILAQMEDKGLLTNLKCSEPSELFGTNFTSLYESNIRLKCVDPEADHPERDASILIGVLIGILLTIPAMMGLLLFCAKKNFYGYIPTTRGPASYTRTFYNRADTLASDNRYI